MTAPEIKSDGGPAFPRTGEGFGNPGYDAPGMSLRDWFAGQALAGYFANPVQLPPGKTIDEARAEVSASIYAFADAMLAERGRP